MQILSSEGSQNRGGKSRGKDLRAIKADTEALEKAFYAVSEKLYQQAGGAQGAQGFDPNAYQQGGFDGGAQSGDGTFYSADYEDNSDK